MTYRSPSLWVVALALAVPASVFADQNGNANLASGAKFSLDTDTTVTSGGDIQFNGTTITFLGNAGGFSLGAAGTVGFGTITQQTAGFLTYSSTAISGSTLVATEVFVVHTNGGNYAKVLITAVTASTLSITYDSFIAGNSPTITAVLDAGSYTSSLAQGSVFVVKGTNLSATGYTAASFTLPTTLANVSISFSPLTGGSGTSAYMIYDYNQNGVNQLAAIVPSNLATGSYSVSVTYNGSTSSGFTANVVQRKPGLITADSSGNGLVVAQNAISQTQLDLDRFTTGNLNGYTISPAKPGQVIIAWATGLGPVPGGDNIPSTGYNFVANGINVQVIVGGMTIVPAYAGRAPGLAGTDQINVALPANVPTGCTVPFQLSVNGVLSQQTFISIAPSASATTCVQAGYTSAQLQGFDNGNIVYQGGFTISTNTGTVPSLGTVTIGNVGGSFIQYTGYELSAIPAGVANTPPSGCTVYQIPQPASNVFTGGSGIALDAGKITLSAPAASNVNGAALTETSNAYSLPIYPPGLSVPGTVNGSIVAGTYTLNAAGGQGVGKFTASVTLPTPLTVTNGLPTTVNRSSGLNLTWTGGNPSDIVAVTGIASNPTGPGGSQVGAGFICYTTAGAGGITVSSSILNQLPAVTAAAISTGSVGGLGVSSILNTSGGNGAFSAPLVAGGNINAAFGSYASTGNQAAYQ